MAVLSQWRKGIHDWEMRYGGSTNHVVCPPYNSLFSLYISPIQWFMIIVNETRVVRFFATRSYLPQPSYFVSDGWYHALWVIHGRAMHAFQLVKWYCCWMSPHLERRWYCVCSSFLYGLVHIPRNHRFIQNSHFSALVVKMMLILRCRQDYNAIFGCFNLSIWVFLNICRICGVQRSSIMRNSIICFGNHCRM